MNFSRRRILQAILMAPIAYSCNLEAAVSWRRHLVLVELNGGNDGLNTVVPYADPLYYRMRPKIGLARHQVLHIDETLGLHPGLEALMPLWLDGQIAIALGVGYSQPNLSHFRSIEIWETATSSNSYGEIGWLARLFREYPPPASRPANGILLGRNAPGPFSGDSGRVIALKNLEKLRIRKRENRSVTLKKANPLLAHVVDVQNRMDLVERRLVAKNLNNVKLPDNFPLHNFGTQMKTAAKLIVGGSGVPVIKCSLGSFDTHAGQIQKHRRLMMQLAEGLSSFSRAMKNAGKWDDILIMTYSEFGRRPRENASGGTDHGTAAPHFLMGGKVNGGLFGEQPPLNDLNGLNLSYRTDFRTLYATVARQWFGLKAPFLGSRTLPIIV